MNYTLAQLEAFLVAESEREGEALGLHLTLTAVACQGDKRAIEHLLRELNHEAESDHRRPV